MAYQWRPLQTNACWFPADEAICLGDPPLNEIVPTKVCIPKEVGLQSQRIGVRFLNLGRGLILLEPPNVNPPK